MKKSWRNENEVSLSQTDFIKEYFIQKVSPALVTIILNDLIEFPVLKDGAAYLVVKMILKRENPFKKELYLFDPDPKDIRYALIEIPKTIDRFVVLPSEHEKNYIIMLDDLIRYCMGSIFNMFVYESLSAHMIKITRDAELDIDNDLSKSFIEKISTQVNDRKISDPVRFVYTIIRTM